MNRRKFFANFASDKSAREPHVSSPGPAVFTNARLLTHENKVVRFYDDMIRGKQVIINLMYATCEGLCPQVTSKLIKVHETLKHRMGKDLFMHSITIKPEVDDPAALKHYADMHNALLPGWTFLTGDPYDIETIRFRLFRMDHIAIDTDIFSHTSSLRIINDSTNRWVEVNPLASMHAILRTISLADPRKSLQERLEENRRLQEQIDQDVKKYGYRKVV
jgi:protein SCO1/2